MATRHAALLVMALVAATPASEPSLRHAMPSLAGEAVRDSEESNLRERVPEGAVAEAAESSTSVWPPWVEPGTCNLGQLAFLTAVYGYVLFTASGMISDGSELLLLVPSIAGLVGSVVLPILGAVPDGMMVLFSGLGPRAQAQEQVSVGVGALAGSTVMLLTFPWFIAIFAGSVPIRKGRADYRDRQGATDLFSSGVAIDDQIKKTAKIMIATTMLYVIIQLPASITEAELPNSSALPQAKRESSWSLLGLVSSVFAFAGYVYYCYQESKNDNKDKDVEEVIKQIENKSITIAAALDWAEKKKCAGALLAEDDTTMKKVLRPFFRHFDHNNSMSIDSTELGALLVHLGAPPVWIGQAADILKNFDRDKNATLSFDEFCTFIREYMKHEDGNRCAKREAQKQPVKQPIEQPEEEEEEEMMPDDLADLPVKKQMEKVLFRACRTMGLGTLLVLIFSDPMVDVLSEWGNRSGVPNFYVSFVLAPFASNASELLAAYSYASKKTKRSIINSLSSLLGAACMNNTFCLAIFLALCHFQSLAWQFTAETVAIILVQWLVGILAMRSDYQTRFMACGVLACYPGCLFIVYVLENFAGLD